MSLKVIPKLLSLDQAAKVVNLSRRSVERLIAAGEFPKPQKFGRLTRVRVADLEAHFGIKIELLPE